MCSSGELEQTGSEHRVGLHSASHCSSFAALAAADFAGAASIAGL